VTLRNRRLIELTYPKQIELFSELPKALYKPLHRLAALIRVMNVALVTSNRGGQVGCEEYLRRIGDPDPAKGEIRSRTFIQHVQDYQFSAPKAKC
jgi:hypothetical protein